MEPKRQRNRYYESYRFGDNVDYLFVQRHALVSEQRVIAVDHPGVRRVQDKNKPDIEHLIPVEPLEWLMLEEAHDAPAGCLGVNCRVGRLMVTLVLDVPTAGRISAQVPESSPHQVHNFGIGEPAM